MNLFPVKVISSSYKASELYEVHSVLHKLLLVLFISGTIAATADARQISDKGSLSGLLYSDFYWIVNNHNEDLEGENGFWARRVYLTYDNNFSQHVSARFRLEMNSPGDFSTNQKLEPYVKDLYLDWAINQNHSLIAGLSSTPTWALVESVWGYRSVEKSPSDLHKLGSSRDFGLALKGEFGDRGNLKYHAMIGNGSGTGSETNKWKKYMLSLGWWLSDNLVVEVYGEYNRTSETTTRSAVHGFLGYVSDNLNAGAMYVAQNITVDLVGISNNTETIDVASIFANLKLADKWTALLRADRMFTANPRGPTIDYIPFSDQAESTFLLFGVDFEPVRNVHVIPNIETIFYGEAPDGTTPNSDLIFRTTLSYRF
ncbi:hypothetical protein DYD21_18315 [Rhodohalobacter sp. SW132]|uniref:hypothetical protein n=1 Tax=Rhodohalobacter sp. SW132 TaxID=2293433 RepID=UPI000E22C389|nr:hypothetical protein [Rhodohalobacter sp. SW132]REL24543.1 hypothetical protein DYD21_18315 [Rhodohalobacter sp. SW132]